MNGNDFMAWVLRSPLHGLLSNGMMLITVTGRKTGKKYTTPVSFYKAGDYLWIMSSRDRIWWKNLLTEPSANGAEVELLLKRKTVKGVAEPELDENAVAKHMQEYFRHVPQAARPMKVRIENGAIREDDAARLAKERLFVKIKLS